MATGTVPAAMRWASPSAIAVLPTPAAPTSAGLFFPCRRRMSMVRAISSSRQRTVSSRSARASAVRSRVKRASAPESERSERKESSITTLLRGLDERGRRLDALAKSSTVAAVGARNTPRRDEVAPSDTRAYALDHGTVSYTTSRQSARGRAKSVRGEEDAPEQPLAPEQHDERRGREKDAERHERKSEWLGGLAQRELGLRRAAATTEHGDRIDDREEGDRPDRRTDEHRGDRARRSERRADERHQRHVAHAHGFAPERRLAQPADDGDQPSARAGADERVERTGEDLGLAQERGQQRPGEHDDEARDGEAGGDEIVLEIRDRDAEEKGHEERESQRREGRAVMVDTRRPEQPDEQLHRGVDRGDGFVAAAAASAEDDPA